MKIKATAKGYVTLQPKPVKKEGVKTNVSDLVFSCTQGDIPYKVVLYSTSTTGGMAIDLTGAADDAFKITTPTGTFTIPAGDLSITVA